VRLVLAGLLALALTAPPASPPGQGTTTTSLPQVPTQDIVPQPNSGTAPHEAGDRGGALQLTVLGLMVIAVGGAVVMVVRQSRRARRAADSEL
jgi:hypothetical protein